MVEAFRDDAFETHLAGMLAKAGTIADNVVGEVQSGNSLGEERLQAFLAFDQRQGRSALAVQIEKIEGKEDQAIGLPLIHRGLQSAK